MFIELMRKIVPRKIQTAVAFVNIFNNKYGHSNKRMGYCLNSSGEPIPWITYPCMEFLGQINSSDKVVFEYGSGSSTLWWAKRSRSVYAIDRDASWIRRIEPDLPENAIVRHCHDETLYADEILKTENVYDVIVIDGSVRYPCAERAIEKLSKDGIIILDNSEWYPNTCEFITSNGFSRIDFIGISPINAFASCTSLFIRNLNPLNNRIVCNGWTPIGGKFLIAHDDKPLNQIDPATLLM